MYIVKINPWKRGKQNGRTVFDHEIFLEAEYDQESLVYLLRAAEAAYTSKEQAEAKLIANSAKYYLKVLQGELKAAINRMDSYIEENAKKQWYNRQRYLLQYAAACYSLFIRKLGNVCFSLCIAIFCG